MRRQAEEAAPPQDFIAALRQSTAQPALIAEAKKASPSKGLLATNFDPLKLAQDYQESGAAAMSVLTDVNYFQGHLDYLRQIAALPQRLPLLRKDFLFDPYQVYEARAAGADAVLLIVAHLSSAQLRDLHQLAVELGMAALVEVHTQAELEAALACDPQLVGINNRDLHTFCGQPGDNAAVTAVAAPRGLRRRRKRHPHRCGRGRPARHGRGCHAGGRIAGDGSRYGSKDSGIDCSYES